MWVLYGIAVDLIFTTVFRYVFISSDDQGKSVITVLLDLSTAFDTVDHNVLFSRLKDMFGLSSKVLESFRSVSVLYITTYQMFDSLFKEYRFFFLSNCYNLFTNNTNPNRYCWFVYITEPLVNISVVNVKKYQLKYTRKRNRNIISFSVI